MESKSHQMHQLTVVFSGKLNGTIQLPASKSISNRALILNALSENPHAIRNLSDCDDTKVMIQAFTSNDCNIDIGAAGTSMRFLTAYLSTQEGEWTITGTERMKNRPIGILVDALRQVGADIDYMEKQGFPPLKIKGKKLRGGSIFLPGNVSSQFISALMMIAPLMLEGLTLHLTGKIISKPYIRMTMRMMETFGICTDWDRNTVRIEPQQYKPCEFVVESDWSAASYWYESMFLSPDNSEIELLGLHKDSMQGDSAVADIFEQLGVSTAFTDQGVRLYKTKGETSSSLFEYDFIDLPDLAQTLVVACGLKNIPFRFTGLQSLKIKETDRIAALQKEMKKLGCLIYDKNDSQLEWTGEHCESEPSPAIDTYEDHRMAMAFAPAAIVRGRIMINEPSVVSKSYLHFWEDMKTSGYNIEQYDGLTTI